MSININLPVFAAITPSCSDLQPLVDVEDLTFPSGWRGLACKAAQRRHTCPDLREKKREKSENQNSGGASGQPRRLVFPKRDAHCNGCLRKFAKSLSRLSSKQAPMNTSVLIYLADRSSPSSSFNPSHIRKTKRQVKIFRSKSCYL